MAVTAVLEPGPDLTSRPTRAALQGKLDEIIRRVLPGADPRLVHLEKASEGDLLAVGQRHDRVRTDALDRHLP